MWIEGPALLAGARGTPAITRESSSFHCRSVSAAVVNRGHLHVAVEVVSVRIEEVDPNVWKVDVSIEVREVVFERPALDFTLRSIGSAVGIRVASIALVEPLLVVSFELVIERDVLDASVAVEKAIDLVQIRLEDLRVVLQFARSDEACVELLTPLVVTRIVLARIVIAFPSVCLQQTLAAVGQEHRHVPVTRHPSRVDEAQFAEVAELGVPRVQGPIVAVAEVLGWDNSEGADCRQCATLRAPQRVLAVAVEYALTLGSSGKVELAQEHVSRIGAVALTHVAITRILVALTGILSGSRVMLEHGRTLARKTLPRVAACDRSWRLDSNNRHHLHHLAVILVGPLLGPV
jgi:hypothetical protein